MYERSTKIRVKGILEQPLKADGTRVLVDELSTSPEAQSSVHVWLKALAPSKELKLWFRENPSAWTDFRKRYLKELRGSSAAPALTELHQLAAKEKSITLLVASEEQPHNHAVILREVLEGIRKPPTGTGRAGLRLVQHRIAKRATI